MTATFSEPLTTDAPQDITTATIDTGAKCGPSLSIGIFTAIPTLGQWGLIVLGLILLIVGVRALVGRSTVV